MALTKQTKRVQSYKANGGPRKTLKSIGGKGGEGRKGRKTVYGVKKSKASTAATKKAYRYKPGSKYSGRHIVVGDSNID